MTSEEHTEFAHQGESKVTAPIYMLNVLWFKPEGGVQKYQEYSQAAMPFIQKHGGRPVTPLLYPQQTLIGELDADLVFIIEFPSLEHFQQLLADPKFQEVSLLRDEALTDSLLVQCSAGDLAR
jgi:uncharacterized protein (DUF1330 family)